MKSAFDSMLKESTKAKDLNLPRTDNFFRNSRGQVLHYRHFFPVDDQGNQIPMSCVVIFSHGFTSHCNRPTAKLFGEQLNKRNIGFVGLDYHGHGYSEGTRVSIRSYEHMIDDLGSFLTHMYIETKTLSCPFVLMGQSLGGAVSIAMSSILSEDDSVFSRQFSTEMLDSLGKLRKLFLGAYLLCPALSVDTPHPALLFLLDYVFVPLFPDFSIPPGLTTAINENHTWADPNIIAYIRDDSFPENPEGLTVSFLPRLCSAQSILNLMTVISQNMHQFSFPFRVLHDPEDKVAHMGGTLKLYESCSTPTHLKSLVNMENGLHDLFTNKIDGVYHHLQEWIQDRLQERGE